MRFSTELVTEPSADDRPDGAADRVRADGANAPTAL